MIFPGAVERLQSVSSLLRSYIAVEDTFSDSPAEIHWWKALRNRVRGIIAKSCSKPGGWWCLCIGFGDVLFFELLLVFLSWQSLNCHIAADDIFFGFICWHSEIEYVGGGRHTFSDCSNVKRSQLPFNLRFSEVQYPWAGDDHRGWLFCTGSIHYIGDYANPYELVFQGTTSSEFWTLLLWVCLKIGYTPKNAWQIGNLVTH